MAEARLDRLPVTAILLEKDGRFFFHASGFGIIESGESVQEAYEKLVESRRGYLEGLGRAGLKPSQILPAQSHGLNILARELGVFLTKTCIVFLLIAGIGVAVSPSVERFVESLFETQVASRIRVIRTISAVDVVNKVAEVAQDFQALSEGRKGSLRQSIDILSREASPMVDVWLNAPSKAETVSPPAPSPSSR
ncbi:MAG: hypothetical protein EXR02_09500 [Rhodospirillales bacterium]|nr:hypothetical protein [Rhodospirillales bacterium]